MAKWAYEMSDQELLDEFMNACARAGTSNSGLVIDFSAGSDRAEAHYLRGVVLSRIDGEKPPFARGDKVILNQPTAQSVNKVNYSPRFLKEGEVHEVSRIYYEGKRTWALSFKDDEQFRYFAACFAKTDQDSTAVKKHRVERPYAEYGSIDASAE